MSNIQVSKSILAKLLATENITVSHQATQTAYFDLKNRTLVCPVWKDMDGTLYDLLMGHEVGHALETPMEGWHNALENDGKPVSKRFKGFLNVLEDARIEKKIKRRYPGLARSFNAAYKDLYERDFFGIKEVDVNKLNLIDRINLRFKMGTHVPVSFTDEERAFVAETENLETWDQVVDLAKRIFGYVKDEEESKIKDLNDLKEEIEEQNKEFKDESSDGEDEFDYDADDDSDYEDDIDGNASDSEDGESELEQQSNGAQSKESDVKANDESEDDAQSSKGGGEEDSGEPESVTDRSFRQREHELVNASGAVEMYELPEANLDKIILPNQTVMNDLECFVRRQVADKYRPYGRNGLSYETVLAKCSRKFHSNNKKFINHILKEFEMRKRASQYARSLTSKTGELNMNVLHNYKFSNDLFKKITVAPKGKNHGLIMYVDMSGSMVDIMRNTIEQTLVLVSFCKLAGIPYEVYGFSNDAYSHSNPKFDFHGSNRFTTVSNGLAIEASSFHLKHLIGSSLSPAANRRAFSLLCVVANEYARGYGNDEDNDHGLFDYNWESAGFGLNGTPFIQTLLASREQIKKFQIDRKLDIVNVIYLTDGDGSSSISIPYSYDYRQKRPTVYFVDKKTKKKIRYDHNMQAEITQLVREVTGCKHIGFFLCSETDLKYKIRDMVWSKKITEQDGAKFRKNFRDDGFVAAPSLGYDNYFFIRSSRKSIEEKALQINDKMTKNKMASEFKKSIASKKNNRALVSKFTEDLAVA